MGVREYMLANSHNEGSAPAKERFVEPGSPEDTDDPGWRSPDYEADLQRIEKEVHEALNGQGIKTSP